MRVARVGLTPVKGGRHLTHTRLRLEPAGAVGDRVFCLVDPATDRCLRTVENPTLLATAADWDGSVLTVELPAGTVTGEPVPTGEGRTVDYWGRRLALPVVAGPWAAAYAEHLGRDVVLAAAAPGDVVYGGPVTLVTSSSLAAASAAVGSTVVGARFRPTLELDTGDLSAGIEQQWAGRRLRVGGAELRVGPGVVRCAVVDLDPATGARDLPLLKSLARDGEVVFGVEAEVVVAGDVVRGDPVALR